MGLEIWCRQHTVGTGAERAPDKVIRVVFLNGRPIDGSKRRYSKGSSGGMNEADKAAKSSYRPSVLCVTSMLSAVIYPGGTSLASSQGADGCYAFFID